jgi:phage baseplate assembly protein W
MADNNCNTQNQSARVYEFRSVGIRDDFYKESRSPWDENEVPIGIKTPLEIGEGHDGLLKMHKNLADQVHDNFRNLILTNHGDRLGFYDFGANLTELTHEIGSEDGDKEAIRRISKAASKYAPFITLQTFEAFTDNRDNEHTGKLGIRVIYDIPKLSVVGRAIEVILYSTG